MIGRFLIAGVALSLSACSGAIHWDSQIEGTEASAIGVDARQRLILSQRGPVTITTTTNPTTGKIEEKRTTEDLRRFCAEPSPDAFTVLGVAASGGGSLGLDSNSKTLNAAIQGAFSSNETGATIARTQTVNLLREMMFRTCERYLSGAISKEQFQTIAARDQRVIVSILAIEQLTGSINPGAVAIGSNGNAGTGFDPTELGKALDERRAAVKTAETTLTTKQGEFKKVDTKDGKAGVCQPLFDKKAKDEAWKDDAEKASHDACAGAKGAVDTAQSELEAQQALYNGLLTSINRGQGISSAGNVSVISFGNETARLQAMEKVSQSVENIVALTFNQDETLLFCLQVLGSPSDKLAQVINNCVEYLKARADADAARLLNMSVEDYRRGLVIGARSAEWKKRVAPAVHACLSDPAKRKRVKTELVAVGAEADDFLEAATTVETIPAALLLLGGETSSANKKLKEVCGIGDQS